MSFRPFGDVSVDSNSSHEYLVACLRVLVFLFIYLRCWFATSETRRQLLMTFERCLQKISFLCDRLGAGDL